MMWSRGFTVTIGSAAITGALLWGNSSASAQATSAAALPDASQTGEENKTAAPIEKVDVAPVAEDSEIAKRLERILTATDWFIEPKARVDEGVVFLTGVAENEEVKQWAGNLARHTQDVVAVVNRLKLERPPLWNLDPATDSLRSLWRDSIALLPFIAFSLVILIVSAIIARLTVVFVGWSLRKHLSSGLLRDVVARAVGFMVFILGIYVVLRVSGLTRLALTVLGGTGLLGLVIGIAFRDITENYLSSIFLSMRRPFLTGDFVQIAGEMGLVQRLTTRSTVMMSLSGVQVEIPNATVYRSTIRNFTTNKNHREDFTVGIGYDVPIADAQAVALEVLNGHEAVLKDPEPWALVDSLGSAVVVLRIYFWTDGTKYNVLKVKSSLIRLLKGAFQAAGIDMPDEAREVVFPQGVPVQMISPDGNGRAIGEPAPRQQQALPKNPAPQEPISTQGEADLSSNTGEIQAQAHSARQHDEENLLNGKNSASKK